MIRHDEIEQQSLEWFEIKWGKIGGTLSKGLFVDSDTLFIDLLSQHIEEFEFGDGFKSDAMERGNDMEPFALEYLKIYTGIDFENTGWISSSENDILGISPDAISKCGKFAAEIKCLARKAHTEIIYKNETPKDKIHQIVHYFTVIDTLEKLYFEAYRPESIKPYIIEYTPESVVDIGWKKKVEVKQYGVKGQEIKPKIETVTDFRTIKEWTIIAKIEAEKLQTKIKETIKQLNF